jgi:hypothetical protein
VCSSDLPCRENIWGVQAQLHAQAASHTGEEPSVDIGYEASGPQNWCGTW